MNEQELELWVYRQVEMLISQGYIDPSRRAEVEQKMLDKKRETEVSLKNDP